MTGTSTDPTPTDVFDPRDIVIDRTLAAPREKVWRCWTEPTLLKAWFMPKPVVITQIEMELKPCGRFDTAMRMPNGEERVNRCVILEATAPERLVWTNAYSPGWLPSERPIFTAVMTFEDAGDGRTRYLTLGRHFTMEGRQGHEASGFGAGWAKAAERLEALANTL